MTYSSPNKILADDVANQFWNTYFGDDVLPGGSFNLTNNSFTADSGFPSQPGSQYAPGRSITGTTLKASTSTMDGTNVFNAFKTEVNRFTGYYHSYTWLVHRTYYQYSGHLYQTAVNQSVSRWLSAGAWTYTAPSNNLGSSDRVTTGEFNTLFSSFASNYSTQSTSQSITDYDSYTQCHSSCHTSCHTSRSRR
jgi:hypothetical protein